MTVAELLSQLRARGVELRVDGERLKAAGQKGALTPELQSELKVHKEELLQLLGSIAPARRSESAEQIPSTPNQETYPLSVTQGRALAAAREGNALPTAFRLRGPLRPELLRTCLEQIVQRHAPLRTVFELDEGSPSQRVLELCPVSLETTTLPDGKDRETALSKTLAELRRVRFDVTRLPLFSFRLIQLSESDHVLFLAFSPLIFDGWSFDVFWNELRLGYGALAKGDEWPFAPLQPTYADFVAWQDARLQQKDAELSAFWREHLGSQLPPLPLQPDHPRKRAGSASRTIPFQLPASVTHRLRSFAVRSGATPQLVMLAGVFAWVSRLGGERRVIVGTPVEGRRYSGLEQQIGPFVNMLLLPQEVDIEGPFEGFVKEMRDRTLAAYEHDEYPIERLAVRSARTAAGGVSPAFQVEFSFQQVSRRSSHMGPVAISQLELESGAATNDVTLWVKDWGDRIAGAFEFKADLFDTETIEHWSGCYVEYLSNLMTNAESPMAEVDVLGELANEVHAAEQTAAKNPPAWLKAEISRLASGHAVDRVRVVDGRGASMPLRCNGRVEVVQGGQVTSLERQARLDGNGGLEQPLNGTVTSAPQPASLPHFEAPKTDLEKRIARLFEQLLEIERVGNDDDYFQLGGNSLVALKLFAEIQRTCGVRVPQATLLKASTPRSLARHISESFHSGEDPLVVLREGSADKALFMIHDGDGETLLYLNLARRLKPEYTVYGLHPHRSGNTPMVDTTVEAAAKYYVEQMKRVRPHGPYHVGGLCAGGVLAFAIARELETQAAEVGVLAIGEAAPDDAEKRQSVQAKRIESASRVARRLSSDPVGALREAATKAWSTGTFEAKRIKTDTARRARCLLLQQLRRTGRPWPDQLEAPSVRDVWEFAVQRYRPTPLCRSNPILIRASRGDGTASDQPLREKLVDPLFEWQPLSPYAIRAVDVDGGHSTMWQEPHVADLAKKLNEFLP